MLNKPADCLAATSTRTRVTGQHWTALDRTIWKVSMKVSFPTLQVHPSTGQHWTALDRNIWKVSRKVSFPTLQVHPFTGVGMKSQFGAPKSSKQVLTLTLTEALVMDLAAAPDLAVTFGRNLGPGLAMTRTALGSTGQD